MLDRKISQPFYRSSAWRKTRAAYIKSVGGLCERCMKNNAIVLGRVVHHKIYITEENINDPEITLNWNNLEYLCQDCHNKEHFGTSGIIEDGLAFDQNGNLIQVRNSNQDQNQNYNQNTEYPP